MMRYFSISLVLVASIAAGTLRAATTPHVGPASVTATWTNEDLKRLSRISGLVSIVGEDTNESLQRVGSPAPLRETEDPAWYATQAAQLNARLDAAQADLRNFTHALEDARELKATTGGINLAEGDIGITPEATIKILRNRVRETQSELDALEELARRNGMPPGIVRGLWQRQDEKTKQLQLTEQSRDDRVPLYIRFMKISRSRERTIDNSEVTLRRDRRTKCRNT